MQLNELQTGRHCAIYLLSDGKSCPAEEFLEEAERDHEKELTKLLALLDRCCEHGLPHNREKVRSLGDGLFEFKTGGGLRLLWFWDKEKMILCTHGFVKKTQKTPKAQKETAMKWKKAYFDAKGKGKIQPHE